MKRFLMLILTGIGFLSTEVMGQDIAIKTNLLYDATTSINLGVEFGLGRKTTLDIPVTYNPWTFDDGRKMKFLLAQPEFRYWLCERFNGHFFGLHAHGAIYNYTGMLPWGFNTGKMFGKVESSDLMRYRYEGWLVGAGVSWGYHWVLNNHWSLETNIGVGYAYLNYDKYHCQTCGGKIGNESQHYFGPTRAGITLVYMIK